MTERDLRSELLNTLLTTPHRNLASIDPFHKTLIENDPIFYVHLAAWYADHGHVRDHKEMFVIYLCLSSFPGHREVGLALLRRLPPYEVARLVDYVKGYELRRKVRRAANLQGGALAPAAPPSRRPPLSRLVGIFRHVPDELRLEVEEGVEDGSRQAQVKRAMAQPEWDVEVEKVGLFRNVPRSMRTEVERYLREREADARSFDRTALSSRKALKRLYAGLHIAPGPRAQAVLFDENPPEGSQAAVLKAIARAATPAEQARLIAEQRIPYRVAASAIREMSPMVVAALVEVMTPQEVINSLAALKKRGALENKYIKSLVDEKLAAAKKDKRVSAFKAKVAAEAAGATGELAQALDEVTEAQVKSSGRIGRPTALLIDKSGSMDMAIEVGRQLGAMVSAICESDLYAYAFDTVAYPVQPQEASLAGWEKALTGINAGGSTSCGVAIDWMRRKRQVVEQIVMVTDEGENTAPRFQDAYQAYAEELKVRPAVILIKIGQACQILEAACTALGVAPQVFEFRGDYYALPNVIPLLTYPSLSEMVMEVLSYPLPERKPA